MTRAEILQAYIVSDSGVIKSPGKFEAEMLYVPYFWEQGLDGCSSEDISGVYFFEVGPEDRILFPEIGDSYGLALEETDTGFVVGTAFGTEKDYRAAIARMEAMELPEMD